MLQKSKDALKHLEELNELFLTLENEQSIIAKDFTNAIVKASKEKITPDSDNGKKIIDFGVIVRKFGNKLLNLLKIELSISFAGVTLIHFRIPRIDSENNVVDTKK